MARIIGITEKLLLATSISNTAKSVKITRIAPGFVIPIATDWPKSLIDYDGPDSALYFLKGS